MNNGSTPQWFENEGFWRETYPFMFPQRRFDIASTTVRDALKLAKTRGRSALDLCCGPGRCAIALAQRGFSVTGVDRTQYLLNKARSRARRAGVSVEWVRQDMRNFVRPDSYDLALSMFTSFGYFQDRSEDAGVLRNVFASLRPGGVFLMDIMGKEILARNFQPTSMDTLPDGSVLAEQRKIVDGWSRILNTWTVIRGGRAKQFRLELNLYSGQELKEAMAGAGFADVELYGNLDGAEYGPNAARLVAIARKAKPRTKPGGGSEDRRKRQ